MCTNRSPGAISIRTSASRSPAFHHRGRLDPAGRVELVEDVGDVDAGRLDADHERLRNLTVRVAADDEPQHLRLARRHAEDRLQVLLAVRRSSVEWREIEPRTFGEPLESRGPTALPRSELRPRAPAGAARSSRPGRRRRRPAPRPGASDSRQRSANVRGVPRSPPRATMSRAEAYGTARSYSASDSARQPSALGVIVAASRQRAARRSAACARGRASLRARRRPDGRGRVRPAPLVARSPLAQSWMRICAASRCRARGRLSWMTASASV